MLAVNSVVARDTHGRERHVVHGMTVLVRRRMRTGAWIICHGVGNTCITTDEADVSKRVQGDSGRQDVNNMEGMEGTQ